jgi:hypothetical protein
MGTGVRIKFKPGNLRIQEIFWRGSEWVFGIGVAFEKFIDRQSAGCLRRSNVTETNAITEANRSVQRLWNWLALGPGFLPDQTKIADVTGFGWIA